ncbi:MAG: hypothetical protein COB22_07750 [Cycloclasticus sp.]|nr:MAG: hypothetical protein COB22_07750 [Cycloclasticus sp.]
MIVIDDVVVITVTYNPLLCLLRKQISRLSKQCNVVLVDNGSEPDTLKELQVLSESNAFVSLVEMTENMGIAAAQNKGIQAVREGFPECLFIMTLDHDSVPSNSMVAELRGYLLSLQANNHNVAAVGPTLYDSRSRSYLNFHKIKKCLWSKVKPDLKSGPILVDSLNSSGSLISLDAIDSVGVFNADMFIDHIETDWCFRAVKKGYNLYACPQVIMEHAMGDDVMKLKMLGIQAMPLRSPKRHYFIVRNSLFLHRQLYVPKVWKFWNIIKLIGTYVFFGFFTGDSKQQRTWIYKGIVDGWNCKLGGLPCKENGSLK